MKTSMVLVLLTVAALSSAAPGGKYTARYDTVNLDEILANDRLLTPYVNCLLERGKCTAEGKELKSHVREAMENSCAKCTEVQRDGTRRVIGHLINHHPKFWEELTEKYDPTHKYTAKYENELRALNA